MKRKISLDRSIRAAGDCRPFPDGENTEGREPWRYGTDFRNGY